MRCSCHCVSRYLSDEKVLVHENVWIYSQWMLLEFIILSIFLFSSTQTQKVESKWKAQWLLILQNKNMHKKHGTEERERGKKDDEWNDKFLTKYSVWRQRRRLLPLLLRWSNDAFPLHTRTIQLFPLAHSSSFFLPHACVFMCACANASERVCV